MVPWVMLSDIWTYEMNLDKMRLKDLSILPDVKYQIGSPKPSESR